MIFCEKKAIDALRCPTYLSKTSNNTDKFNDFPNTKMTLVDSLPIRIYS